MSTRDKDEYIRIPKNFVLLSKSEILGFVLTSDKRQGSRLNLKLETPHPKGIVVHK